MSGIDPQAAVRLSQSSDQGGMIRELCRMPGFKLYMKTLEDIISDNKNIWLRGSEEDAKNARLEARGIQKAIDILKKFIIEGDNADRILNEIAKADLEEPALM